MPVRLQASDAPQHCRHNPIAVITAEFEKIGLGKVQFSCQGLA
jgi:hypothetical protein